MLWVRVVARYGSETVSAVHSLGEDCRLLVFVRHFYSGSQVAAIQSAVRRVFSGRYSLPCWTLGDSHISFTRLSGVVYWSERCGRSGEA